MPFTEIPPTAELDLEPERLDVGDRRDFVTKMTAQQVKLEEWSAAINAAITAINAMGTELDADLTASSTLLADTAAAIAAFNAASDFDVDELSALAADVEALVAAADGVVASTGNQTIAGIKTFSSSPIVPTPTTTTQAANKAYVDAADNLQVLKTGGTMTGNLFIAKANPSITLRADTGTAPQLNMFAGATSTAQLFYVEAADRVAIIKKDTTAIGGGAESSLNLYADRALFSRPVRVAEQTDESSNTLDLTTKGYVDAAVAAVSNINTVRESGKFTFTTDNRWVTPHDAEEGSNREGWSSQGGTGATPSILYSQVGLTVRNGDILKTLEISLRMDNAEVTNAQVYVAFVKPDDPANNYSTGVGGGTDITTTEVLSMASLRAPGGSYTAWTGAYTDLHRRTIDLGDYECDADGSVVLYIKPVGTITATRYGYCTLVWDVDRAGTPSV